MRIGEPRISHEAGWTRLSSFLDTSQGEREIYFEVPDEFGSWLAETPDPFVAAGAVLSPILEEDIVEVEGACPQLAEGCRTALAWLGHWYPGEFGRIPAIEVTNPSAERSPDGRAACFLSGGIDSLATLRLNLLSFPRGHPGRIDAAIFVNWGVGDSTQEVEARGRFAAARASALRKFGRQVDVDVVEVRSNLHLWVDGRSDLWMTAWHGAFLASVAHALGAGLSSVRLASSDQIKDVHPWGSHPLLEPELSSGSVRVFHDGLRFSRFEKTAVVAAWPEAVEVVNVCVGELSMRLNKGACGPCEKCLRTAAAFTAEGFPDAGKALLGNELQTTDIDRIRLDSEVWPYWSDIAATAESNGQPELARAASRALARFRRRRQLQRVAQPLGIRRVRASLRERRN